MLEPGTRQLLADALRPPADCELVHAVGTTYSLDLQALLFAPLSFAMFDWALDDEGTPNPVALLESLRRYADRTTVFCQAGQIGYPRDYQALFTYLEPTVVPVTPPDRTRIFHPKVWVLRFRPASGGRDRYRVLCLTRNLTFDRSWDTACVLDGERRAGSDTIGRNQPLVDFIRALTQAGRLDPTRREALDQIADDIADVRFAPPEGFESVRFHALGLPQASWPWRRRPRRVLVMSPFLTTGALGRLRGAAGNDVLISRQETLDGIDPAALEGYGTNVYYFSDAVAQPDTDGEPTLPAPTDEMRGDAVDAELQGLHAKLIVAEYADDVRFYTGSANATDAAFGGNVEFLVELRTRQPGVGIDALLARADDTTTLRDIIEPYTVGTAEPAEPTDADAVSKALDVARRTVGALAFTATLVERDDGRFELDLQGTGTLELPPEVDSIRCWRISAAAGHAVTPDHGPHGLAAAFGLVAREGITSFFAFELEARHGSATSAVRFVVNAELVGAPEGRADAVITQILHDRQDVLRYLLFLLSDTTYDQSALMGMLGAGGDVRSGAWGQDPFDAPVFETLLRVLARDPSKLDHIERLLADIRASERADELLPDELDALWRPIWEVRQELPS